MDKIIILVLVLLSLLVIKLVMANKRIKHIHFQKMKQLKDVFKSLSSKQEILNQKASISNESKNYPNMYF